MSKKTIGEQYLEDARIEQAQKLIQEALAEHSSKITGVKGSDPELVEEYEKTLKEFSEYRGGKLFYDYVGSGIGKGALVELCDGSVKYDFITGIGVHYFGHSHPGVVAAEIKSLRPPEPYKGKGIKEQGQYILRKEGKKK